MQIFNPSRFNATSCASGGLQTTPHGSYCQLLGPFVLTLPGYNSIPVYASMNEHCPAQVHYCLPLQWRRVDGGWY